MSVNMGRKVIEAKPLWAAPQRDGSLQSAHALVRRWFEVAQGVVLAHLGVLGLSKPMIREKLIGRSTAGLLDELGDGLDVVFGVVDTRNDRGANDDVDVSKPGADRSSL